MGEVWAPYYTHSNLTLFPKLEDWIFFIKLSLLFTHSRGPLALGTKRSRRGGGKRGKRKKGKKTWSDCWMWGWHNTGLGRRMRCFVLPVPFCKKGCIRSGFFFFKQTSHLSLFLSLFRCLSLMWESVVCQHQALSLSPLWVFDVAPLCCGPPLAFWLVDSRQGGWSIVGLEQGWKQAGQQKGTYTQSLACASSSSLNGLLWPQCEPHC